MMHLPDKGSCEPSTAYQNATRGVDDDAVLNVSPRQTAAESMVFRVKIWFTREWVRAQPCHGAQVMFKDKLRPVAMMLWHNTHYPPVAATGRRLDRRGHQSHRT